MHNEKYLRLLAKDYPGIRAAKGEILRLQALLELPKGTEYFFSDLHGEDGAFIHLMRSASGNIRTKIRELYGNIMTESEQNQLANLISDPQKVLGLVRLSYRDTAEWVRLTIIRLSELCRYISNKYSRENVANKMPPEYAPIISELLYPVSGDFDRNTYYNKIISHIVQDNISDDFIIALCNMIQKICVNHLHIIGDIFDRGKGPHHIMEELINFDRVDIQWGNHDIVWMGAACGNEACMCSVLRNSISYNNFDALEDGYGLNLRALSSFAYEVYGDDPCEAFIPKVYDQNIFDKVDIKLAAKMHKAIAIIMFKLEGQLIERHPEYNMDHRNVLKMIDFERMVFKAGEKEYPLLDKNLPTVDPSNPLKLSKEEEELMKVIKASFMHSEPLHRHVAFLYSHGSTYKRFNNNLLFHGCIPMTEDGEFDGLTIEGTKYAGKALMDYIGIQMTHAYYFRDNSIQSRNAVDFMWYLWCGPKSPMFGKSKMATFENCFIGDKEVCREAYNPYYKLSEEESVCNKIFSEFGMDPNVSHIINGHVPVKIKDGETPVKAGGKLFVIDGGISRAYQPKTGIAGYTLIFNSHNLALAEHHSFEQIENDTGSYTPNMYVVEVMPHRLLTAHTDEGDELRGKIADLECLIDAYQKGIIKEK